MADKSSPSVVELGGSLPEFDHPEVFEFGDSAPEFDAGEAQAVSNTGLGFLDRAAVGIQGLLDQVLAAVQGTSPIVEDLEGNARMARMGDLVESDAGFQFEDESGKLRFIDPRAHVVLRGRSGKLGVFARTPETDENMLMSAGRLLNVGALTSPVTSLPLGATQATQASRAAQAFERAGVTPNLPAITESRGAKVAQNVLLDTPGAGGPVERSVSKMAQETAESVERVAASAGQTSTRDQAGRAVVRGIEQFTRPLDINDPGIPFSAAVRSPSRTNGFRVKARALFDKIDEFIPGESEVSIANAKEFVTGLGEKFSSAPKLGKVLEAPLIKQISKALEDVDALTYSELKFFRSELGAQLASPSIIGNPSSARMKSLYSALTRDMEEAARAAGPEATKAFNRANQFYNAAVKRIEDVLEPILKLKTDESVFEKVLSFASDKGRGGVAQLNALKRSLTPDEFNEVVSVVIRRMGKPPSSSGSVIEGTDFSPLSFVTNYGRLSERGREVLFRPDLQSALDDLLLVSKRQGDITKLRGNSGTPRILIPAAMAGTAAATGDVFSAVGLLVAANVGARLILSPQIVRWVAQAPNKEIGPHLARLRALAGSDPDLGDDIEAFADLVEQHLGSAAN